MSEEEWDPVLATHLKGTFTVFRAASAVMRAGGRGHADRLHQRQPPGERVPGQLQRGEGRDDLTGPQRGAGLHRYGVTANAVAPVARTRMSAGVPMELAEIGEPEDVAALVVYLLSERARAERITGQVYTIAGPKIAVWAQPRELRSGYGGGGGLDPGTDRGLPAGDGGGDPMPMLARVEEMAAAARAGARPNQPSSPSGD
ncbi:SDR family oxidoreductase OS=Streptomyces microflavus OX=1919 GN=G3I39_05385 PE=3 SV=1 [Streptomyces microflavus]